MATCVADGEANGMQIELVRFSVRFPTFHFEPLTLSVGPGSRIALLGPNGAGKSTLLRALAGRFPHYQGSVRFRGAEVRDLLPGYRVQVGFLPENLIGTPGATVRDRLELHSAFFPSWDQGYAEDLLSKLDLSEDAPVGALSKGMALKFSFVAAEAYRPPLLLLDEPTSGLDPVVRRTFLTLLREILDEDPDRTLVFSTHLLEDVEAFAEHVWILRSGRMIRNARVAEMVSRDGGGLPSVLYEALDPAPSD